VTPLYPLKPYAISVLAKNVSQPVELLLDDIGCWSAMSKPKIWRRLIACVPAFVESDKSRWLKVDSHIEWARKLLQYSDQESQEEQTEYYSISDDALELISSFDLSPEIMKRLNGMKDLQFKAKEDFVKILRETLEISGKSKSLSKITYCASDANRKFMKYFSWIKDFRADIEEWDEAIWLLKSAKIQVKQEGLSRGTYEWYSNKHKNVEFKSFWTRDLQRDMTEYLKVQGAVVPEHTVWPGTSDIIESIFGKYKNFL
jgi:hypothetical protein